MLSATTHGAPNWVDLSTPDIEAATEFYGELLGWDVTKSSTPMGDYYVGHVGDHETAGMMAQSPEMEGMPATWTVFFSAEDIDATAAAAEAAGGQILTTPFEIPGGARVCVLADPTGAMFALISGNPPIDSGYLSRTAGDVAWLELLTRDPEAAIPFYRTLFGWEVSSDDSAEDQYTMFTLEGEQVAGLLEMPSQIPAQAPSHWGVYFAVDNCVSASQRATELGAHILVPSTEADRLRFAVLSDPQGATFDLIEFPD